MSAPGSGVDVRPGEPTADRAIRAAQESDAAAASLDLRIVEIRSPEDCAELVAVLDRIWDTGPTHSVIDLSTVVAMAASGNLVTAVRHGGEVVGGAIGFFGPGSCALHSHIVGVTGDAPRGSGFALKLDQRAWCLEHQITRMTWTFDPLLARNAYFNLTKLGARVVAYHPDHYGVMHDGVNQGQHSDRLLVRWDLDAPLGPRATAAPDAVGPAHVVLAPGSTAEQGPGPVVPPPAEHQGPVLVTLPDDLTALRRRDPRVATAWRLALREAFVVLQGQGWTVAGFDRAGHYVFERTPTP